MKNIYLTFIIIIVASLSCFAEGTLQLITCGTCQAGMSINDKAQFAYPGLTEERRLHIRIGDFTQEDIYVALGQTEVAGAWFCRLVSPSGVQYTYDGTGFVNGGTAATMPASILTAAQNSAGPNGVTQESAAVPTVGSYDSETFSPNENGDWHIEFTDTPGFLTPTVSARVGYWDISVVNTSTADNDVINGRIWSKQWGFRSGPGSQTDPGDFLASTFYVYTEPDQVVTAIEVGDENDPGWGGDWLIACNRYGIDLAAYDNGDPASARQSYNGDAADDFGQLDEYKIFLNDPEILEFPSGVQTIDFSTISIDQCNPTSMFITFVSNVESVADVTLDFPPLNNNGPEDIVYAAQVVDAGPNNLQWDGLDNQGNAIMAGTSFFIRLFAGASTVHFPMYDVEGATGMKARLVRPGTPGYIGLYWDNSTIPAGNAANPITEIVSPGCVSSPAVACNAYGNSNNMTLNMWWNGLETNLASEIVMPAASQATLDAGTPTAICDNNDVIVIPLSATSTDVNVVQWTTNGTGTFDDANIENAIYTPSAADIAAGSVELTISSFACSNVSDIATITIPNLNCVLPIGLSSFDAKILNRNDHCDGIKIGWTTQVEENTSHFVLERSWNGIDYEMVGRLDASGNSTSSTSYTLTDTNISTDNFYRLIAVDLDGTSATYVLNKSVQLDCYEGIGSGSLSELFPNPVYGDDKLVSIKLNMSTASNATIKVKDIYGRTVKSIPTELASGEQIVTFSLEDLNSAIYFINLEADNWSTHSKKLVKISQ